MFKDIRLSIDNNKVDFKYEIDEDKKFIKQILEDDFIVDHLDEKYKNILESSI